MEAGALPASTQPRLKSPLEAMILPLLVRRGVPAPRCNAPVELVDGRIEVDFLWPEQRFVLEAETEAEEIAGTVIGRLRAVM